MKNNNSEHAIGRRDFLHGIAGLTAGAMAPNVALLQVTKFIEGPKLQIHYWNDRRFVSAERVVADRSLHSARVLIHGYGSGPLRTLDLKTHHQGPNGDPVLFHAWSAPPRGAQMVSFVADVQTTGSIHFQASIRKNKHVEVSDMVLGTRGEGPQLRTGLYLLAPEAPRISLLRLSARCEQHPELEPLEMFNTSRANDVGTSTELTTPQTNVVSCGWPLPSQYVLIEIKSPAA